MAGKPSTFEEFKSLSTKNPTVQIPTTKDFTFTDFKNLAAPETTQTGQEGVTQVYRRDVPKKEFESYLAYDVPMVEQNMQNWDEIRAQHQGTWELIGKGLANTGGEILFGTLEGAGYLLDFQQHADTMNGSEKEFSNWFSDLAKSWKEDTKYNIYQTKYAQEGVLGLKGFNPLSGTWWAANAPSIGSAISLLLPTGLAIKGLGMAGKAIGGAKVLKTLGMNPNLIKGVSGAVISRYMENTMEATQSFQQVYNDAINKGKTDEEAKQIAGDAASKTWYTNWVNLAFDIPQYMSIFGSFGKIKGYKSLLGNAVSEALEEQGQYVIQQEAKRGAEIRGKIIEDDKSTFVDRLSDYAKDGEFWTASLMGALGGAVFSGVGQLQQKKAEDRYKVQRDKASIFAKQNAAILKGDSHLFDQVSDEEFIKLVQKHTEDGTLNTIKSDFNNLSQINPKELDLDPNLDSKDLHLKIAQRQMDLEFAEKESVKINNNKETTPYIKRMELGLVLGQRFAERRIGKLHSEVSQLQNQDTQNSNLDNKLTEIKSLINREQALKSLAKDVPAIEKTAIDKEIAKVQKQSEKLINEVKEDKDFYQDLNSKKAILDKIATSNDAELLDKTEKIVRESRELNLIKAAKNSLQDKKTQNELNKAYDDEQLLKKQEAEKLNKEIQDKAREAEANQKKTEGQELVNKAKKEKDNPFYNLIDNATTERELDKISEQATNSNQSTPELVQYISKKREQLTGKTISQRLVEVLSNENILSQDDINEQINQAQGKDLDTPKTNIESTKDLTVKALVNKQQEASELSLSNWEDITRTSTNEFEFETYTDENGKLQYKKINGLSIIKRDKTGAPILTVQVEEFNFKFKDNLDNIQSGDIVKLSVWLDSKYMQEQLAQGVDINNPESWKGIHIKIEVKDDVGNWITVGQLRDYRDDNTIKNKAQTADLKGPNQLEILRKHIFENYKTKNEFFTTVDFKTVGFPLTEKVVNDKGELENVKSPINLLFKDSNIQLAIADKNGFLYDSKGNLIGSGTVGATYAILKDSIPVRLQNNTLNEVEVNWLINKVKALTADNFVQSINEINNIVYTNKDAKLYITQDRIVSKVGDKKTTINIKTATDEVLKEVFSQQFKHIKQSFLNNPNEYTDVVTNQKYTDYNDYLDKTKSLTTDLNTDKPFYGAIIVLNPILQGTAIKDIVEGQTEKLIAKKKGLPPQEFEGGVFKIAEYGAEGVKYALKSVNILSSQKAIDWFKKRDKANWTGDLFYSKLSSELQIPKEQVEILKSLDVKNPYNREELLTSLLANYSYTVEINIATQHEELGSEQQQGSPTKFYSPSTNKYYRYTDELGWLEGDIEDKVNKESKGLPEDAEEVDWEVINVPRFVTFNAQYYSNLTVPGGTNYTENEIATPLITPSIKGHAQFSTDNGIGWFRSDEEVKKGKPKIGDSYLPEDVDFDDEGTVIPTRNKPLPQYEGEATKTRRILEVQSDLFQKGRDSKELSTGLERDEKGFGRNFKGYKEQTQQNLFLQLLNKDSNWVTFFVKSIIQDSAKKGYEKVLFPKGNTASKVEGHTTLEEFKKDKEERIVDLQRLLEVNENEETIQGFKYKEGTIGRNKIDSYRKEIAQLKQELERVEKEGFGALKPIYKFYEENVKNILKKNYQVKEVTDEYGNKWNEVTITPEMKDSMIVLKQSFTNDSTTWNKTQEVNFIKDRLPKVPIDDLETFKRIKGIQDNSIQGVFYNAAIYLHNNAQKGTGYHEAYHAVFRLYTSVKQRMALYAEALQRYSADEIAKKSVELKKSHPTLTDEQLDHLALEELMADEFMNYVISNGAKQVRGKIGAFFKRLLDFIKGIFGKRLTINELFDNINTGVYQNNPIARNVEKFKDKKAYRTLEGFTPLEQTRRLNALNYRVFIAIKKLKENGNINDYTDITPNDLNTIYDEIGKQYYEMAQYEGQQARTKVLHNWQDFVKLSKQSMNRFGYQVADENEDFDIVESKESEQIQEKIYNKDYFTENGKKTLSTEIKMYLNFIPKADKKTGKPLTDDIGDLQFTDFNDLYSYLAINLTDLDSLSEMIDELKELANIKPELNYVVYDLEKNEKIPQSLRNKFFTTFSKQTINFITITNKGFEGDRSFEIFETNRRGLGREIISGWKETYSSPEKNDIVKFDSKTGKLTVDTKKAQELKDNIIGIIKSVKDNQLSETQAKALSDILSQIGISINPIALKNEIKDAKSIKAFLTGTQSVSTLFTALSEGRDIFSLDVETIGEQSTINKLSKIELKARVDGTVASFINGEGNMVYSINMNTAISKEFRKFKDKDIFEATIKDYFTDAYYSPEASGKYNNLWLDTLLNSKEVRDNFKWYVFDTERMDVAGASGTAFNNMNDFLWERSKLNMLLNNGKKYGFFSSPTPADKSNTFFVRFLKNDIELDSKGNLKGQSLDELYKIFMQEVASIKKANWEIENLPKDELILGFHTGQKQGTKFQIFKSFNDKIEGRDFDASNLPDIFNQNDLNAIRKELIEWFNREYQQEVDNLLDLKIIKKNDLGQLLNNEIDNQSLAKFDNDISKIIKYYVFNTVLGYNGITAMTSGNPAYYKSVDDITKRYALWQTPGTDIGNDGVANIAMVKDIKGIKQTVYDSIKQTLQKTGVSKDEIAFIMKKYEDTNHTDAQGYTTMTRHIDVMKHQGTWTEKYDSALNNLNLGQATNEDINLLFSPVKGTYVGSRKSASGRVIPVVVKYSTIPLLPIVTKDYPVLDELRKHMEGNKIDEVVFESAWKVAQQTVGDITKLDTLKPIAVSNSNYRIPLINPYKEKYPIFATQIRWHILSNIQADTNYTIAGKDYNGTDTIKLLNNLIYDNISEDFNDLINRTKLINLEKIKAKEKDAIDINKTEEQRKQAFEDIKQLKTQLNEQLRDILIQEVTKRGNLPDNYEKALDINQDGEFNLPLDFPIFSRKYENMLFSLFKNNVVKQLLPGLSAINESPYGYTDKGGEGLKYFEAEYNDNGEINRIAECEIIVSQDYFKNRFGREVTIEDIPEELRYGIAYRVPNQGKNFMIHFYIKDILPKEAAQQIIGPPELTTQVGLDFDIDKFFLFLPHFNVTEDGKAKYIKYKDGKSREQRDNQILEVYKGILSNPAHFKELVSPNRVDRLKDIQNKIKAIEKPTKLGKTWYSLRYQRESRRLNQAGKQLVGIYSNHAVGYIKMQILKPTSELSFKFNDKAYSDIKDVDDSGTLITDNNAELQSAAVDNAKDPILGDLNDNVYIAPIRAVMNAVGINPETSGYFFKQPILVEFTKQWLNNGSTQNAAKQAYEDLRLEYVNKGKKFDNNFTYRFSGDITSLSDVDMLNSIKTNAEGKQDLEYYKYQLEVLDNFISYRNQANDYNNAVNALGSDSLVSGIRGTLSANELFLDKIEQARAEKAIININSAFPEDSSIKMTSGFTDMGLVRPVEILSNLFAWNTPMFHNVKVNVKEQFGINLNEDLIEDINYNIFNYIFTHPSSPIRIHRAKKKELIIGDKSLAKRLKKFKEYEIEQLRNNPNYEINKFTENLFYQIGKEGEVDVVKFNNTNGSFSNDQKTELSDHFKQLFNNDKTRELAKDLVNYAVLNNGFVKGANSFIDLVPVEIWNSLGLDSWYRNYKFNFDNIYSIDFTEFIDQYIRNNYSNDLLVPRVKTFKNEINELGVKALNPYQIEVNLRDNIRFQASKDSKGNYEFKPYIKTYDFKTKTTKLFKFSGHLNTKQSGRGLYTQVGLLGGKSIMEYDMTLSNMKSIIDSNNIEVRDLTNPDIDVNEDLSGSEFGEGEYAQIPTESGETRAQDEKLNTLLKNSLAKLGVRVEAVASLGNDVAGMAQIYKRLVLIAQDKAKLDTLPEETGHFFVEALGEEHPLYLNLLKDIDKLPVYQEVVEKYSEIYNNDVLKLKKEAIGKALGRAIVGKHLDEKAPVMSFMGKLRAFINRVLQLFRKGNVKDFEKDVENILGTMATQILEGDMSNFDESNLYGGTYYSLGRKINSLEKINENKIKALKARVAKYKAFAKATGSESSENYAETLENFLASIADLETDTKFNELLKRANDDLNKVKKRLEKGDLTPSSLARATEMVSAYIDMDTFLEDSNNVVIKKMAVELEGLRKDLEIMLNTEQESILTKVVYELSSNPRKDFDTVLNAQKDITADQRYLGALANANDTVLASIDRLFKRSIDKVQEESIAWNDEESKLYDAVSNKKDIDLIAQKDALGNNTGNITDKYKFEYYLERSKTYITIEGESDANRKARIRTFYKKYHKPQVVFGEKTEPKDIWLDNNYTKIQNNSSLKAYYDFLVKTKEEDNDNIPISLRSNKRLPSYKKELIESIKQDGLISAFKGLGTKFKEALIYDKDLAKERVVVDESDKIVEFLRTRGTAKLEAKEMSFDIRNIFSAYHHMALMYKHKSEIKDTIDIAKDYVKKRKIPILKSDGTPLLDNNGEPRFTEGVESNGYKRLEDWYNMVFLEQKEKDTGVMNILGKKVSKQKAAKVIGNYGSLNALAFNLFSGFNNIVIGGAGNVIEAAGGEFYSIKDYLWASKEYAVQIPTIVKDNNKLKLMLEYFNVLQETGESKFARSKFWNIPYLFNSAGEHELQGRLFLAMAHNYKITGKDGTESNLWDAYEVLNGKLKLKSNFKGSKISNQDERSDFRNKVKGVNQKIHGRYTDEEAAAIQQYALGYLGMQFRKWVHSGFEARFRKEYFDERLGIYSKGRYLSYNPFIKMLIKYKFGIINHWNELSDTDKANMRRNLMEVTYVIGTMILAGALSSIGDDDEDLKHNRAFNFFAYQADRFNTEMWFYVNPSDAIKIVRSPAASITTIENAIKLSKELVRYPFITEEEATIQKGPHKDKKKVQRELEDMIPLLKEINRWQSLVDQRDYFKRF